MFVHSTNQKGAVAEMEIAAAATRTGVVVLKPQIEHTRYDLVFDLGSRLLRIQCKWAGLDGDVVFIRLVASRYTRRGSIASTYAADEIDGVAAYCGELHRCFYVPIDRVAGRRAIQLRLRPPKNSQRASINLADEYTFPGAVAQWEERRYGIPEGGGSSPPSSTGSAERQSGPDAVEVGAHEFRNHFGWYMERAAAGEEILIKRRGKPHARLGPPISASQQALEPAA
jgi:prevent-host-death family protein